MYTAAEQLLSQPNLTLIKDKEKSPFGLIPSNEFYIHFTPRNLDFLTLDQNLTPKIKDIIQFLAKFAKYMHL